MQRYVYTTKTLCCCVRLYFNSKPQIFCREKTLTSTNCFLAECLVVVVQNLSDFVSSLPLPTHPPPQQHQPISPQRYHIFNSPSSDLFVFFCTEAPSQQASNTWGENPSISSYIPCPPPSSQGESGWACVRRSKRGRRDKTGFFYFGTTHPISCLLVYSTIMETTAHFLGRKKVEP